MEMPPLANAISHVFVLTWSQFIPQFLLTIIYHKIWCCIEDAQAVVRELSVAPLKASAKNQQSFLKVATDW